MTQRKNNVKKGFKSFFSSAPKFQKSLKRGVYLASVVYCEDRILVTSDDVIPIVEVDENYSTASLNSDLHWMMKVACTWDDVKSLRQDMDKLPNSNAFHFRTKLLNAAHALQSALGVQQLGNFYHTPVTDANGSVILVTVTSVRDVKSVSTAHCKWTAYSKAKKKLQTADSFSVTELLMQNVLDMRQYEQASRESLPGGLYVGYLKLTSSMDLINIMVPEERPNSLPYAKVRDNAHVSKSVAFETTNGMFS